MKIDYDIIKKELEKLSKEEILNMCVVIPSTANRIRKFYNLQELGITPTILFFEETPEEKTYNKLIALKNFYDKNKRYPKNKPNDAIETSLSNMMRRFRCLIKSKKISKNFELWCNELNLLDMFYLKRYPTIIQYDFQGTVVKIWKNTSMQDIATSVGLSNLSGISRCLQGRKGFQQSGGYVWRYEKDAFDKYKTPVIYATFPEWQEYCKINNIYTYTAWIKHRKVRKSNMPSDPSCYYKKTGDWPKGGWEEAFKTRSSKHYVSLSEEDIKDILSKKVTTCKIAFKYNCSPSSISHKVKKYIIKNNIDISRIVTIIKYTTKGEKIEEVSGKSLKDISKIFKIDPNKLGNCCRGCIVAINGYIYRRNGDLFDKYPVKYKDKGRTIKVSDKHLTMFIQGKIRSNELAKIYKTRTGFIRHRAKVYKEKTNQ